MKIKSVFSAVILAAVLCISGTVLAACPSADLSGDCSVNLEDFSLLAGQWLTDYDSNDLAAMALEWLTEGIPAEPEVMAWISINDPGVDDTGDGIPDHEGFNGQMSKYETTNAQYCQFLNAALASGDIIIDANDVIGINGTNTGEDFVGQVYYNLAGSGRTFNRATNGGAARINYSGGVFTVDSGFENHPVTYVSWYGATAFCNYYGFRLPTEWEWQAVADYDGSYAYGCGTTINNNIANYKNSTHPHGTTAVGAFGTYGYGMCDMTGNVWEWTSSCYYSDCSYGYRVLRGGSWGSLEDLCTVSYRAIDTLDSPCISLGFRVCR